MMTRGVRLLVSTIATGAMALLAGCATRQPWERDWPQPASRALREEPPYLWCGLEPAEMTRRLVGAFPLGSSRTKVEATIERLQLDAQIVKDTSRTRSDIYVTTTGVVYPAPAPGSDNIVLHIRSWVKYEPGVIPSIALCPYHAWFHFDNDVLRAIEIRQHHVAPRDLADPAAYWREAARKGIVVFTYGMPED